MCQPDIRPTASYAESWLADIGCDVYNDEVVLPAANCNDGSGGGDNSVPGMTGSSNNGGGGGGSSNIVSGSSGRRAQTWGGSEGSGSSSMEARGGGGGGAMMPPPPPRRHGHGAPSREGRRIKGKQSAETLRQNMLKK